MNGPNSYSTAHPAKANTGTAMISSMNRGHVFVAYGFSIVFAFGGFSTGRGTRFMMALSEWVA